MEQIKLEAGRKYLARNPKECERIGEKSVVKIISKDPLPAVTYRGSDGYHYFSDGWLNQYQPSPFDLVREVKST